MGGLEVPVLACRVYFLLFRWTILYLNDKERQKKPLLLHARCCYPRKCEVEKRMVVKLWKDGTLAVWYQSMSNHEGTPAQLQMLQMKTKYPPCQNKLYITWEAMYFTFALASSVMQKMIHISLYRKKLHELLQFNYQTINFAVQLPNNKLCQKPLSYCPCWPTYWLSIVIKIWFSSTKSTYQQVKTWNHESTETTTTKKKILCTDKIKNLRTIILKVSVLHLMFNMFFHISKV